MKFKVVSYSPGICPAGIVFPRIGLIFHSPGANPVPLPKVKVLAADDSTITPLLGGTDMLFLKVMVSLSSIDTIVLLVGETPLVLSNVMTSPTRKLLAELIFKEVPLDPDKVTPRPLNAIESSVCVLSVKSPLEPLIVITGDV